MCQKSQIFPAQSVFSTLIRGYPLDFTMVFGNRVPRLSCGVTYMMIHLAILTKHRLITDWRIHDHSIHCTTEALSGLLLLPAGLWHSNSPACSVLIFSFYFMQLKFFISLLNRCILFRPLVVFPFILPSIISCSSDSCLSTCPKHMLAFSHCV